jgi:adenine-specific DNA-methyltransferase
MTERADAALGVPAFYEQMMPDLTMGVLLKYCRPRYIFSVCNLPDVEVVGEEKDKRYPERYIVRLAGLDICDPITNEVDELAGSDVPCWMLDTDYNELCFHVSQAFFPRGRATTCARPSVPSTRSRCGIS